MSAHRRLGVALALAAAVGGLAVVLSPGLLGGFRLNLYVVVLAGVVAAGMAVALLFTDALSPRPRDQVLPDPDRGFRVPGESFDDRVAGDPAAALDALESRAVEAISRATGEDETAVRARPGDAVAAFAADGDARVRVQRAVVGLEREVTGESADDPALPPTPSLEARAVAWLDAHLPDRVTDRPDRLPDSAGDERAIDRWRGVSALALVALALGVLTRSPGPLLVGAVGVAAATYARPGAPALDLAVEREVSDHDPDRGDEVTVTTRVRNDGGRPLLDLRVADGVPDALAVVDGSPRHAAALGPGRATEFSYTVRAARGEHAFDPVEAVARTASGNAARVERVADETVLHCRPAVTALQSMPLRDRTTQRVGRAVTDAGGTGVELHSVREYRPGDPLARVDWKRYAKTGDLATVEFREERAVRAFLVVDAREEAYRAPEPPAPTAVERSVEAAGRIAATLVGDGHRVGLGALSPTDCWLHSGTGRNHRVRVEDALTTHPALSLAPPDGAFVPTLQAYRLRRRLPDDAQVVLLSPLADDYPVSLVRGLEAAGHTTTVVSPDPTGDGTVGHRLADVERASRVTALRRVGVPVVDWDRDEPLALALARMERWRE